MLQKQLNRLSFTRNTPLWQRGVRGDFINLMIVFVLKIPLSPPFPKGDVKDIPIVLCEPIAHVISSEGGNPDGIL